jgi:DNA-binding MarR family transcriptional regulator
MTSGAETHRPALPPALAERLGFLLGKSHHLLVQRMLPELDPGFTMKHFGALSVIASEGPLSQQQLGARIGLDRTTVVAIIDGLERAGYVKRHRNPDDRRAYALEVTAAGHRFIARVGAELLKAEDEFLTPLSASERRTLVELLQRLLVGQPAELLADPPVEVRAR